MSVSLYRQPYQLLYHWIGSKAISLHSETKMLDTEFWRECERGCTVYEKPRYKPEDLGFDSRWGHLDFSLTFSRLHYGLGVDSTSNRNEQQKYFLGFKGSRCAGLTLPPPCADWKSGRLNILEPSESVQVLLLFLRHTRQHLFYFHKIPFHSTALSFSNETIFRFLIKHGLKFKYPLPLLEVKRLCLQVTHYHNQSLS